MVRKQVEANRQQEKARADRKKRHDGERESTKRTTRPKAKPPRQRR